MLLENPKRYQYPGIFEYDIPSIGISNIPIPISGNNSYQYQAEITYTNITIPIRIPLPRIGGTIT